MKSKYQFEFQLLLHPLHSPSLMHSAILNDNLNPPLPVITGPDIPEQIQKTHHLAEPIFFNASIDSLSDSAI
jgi:hypothetical protein